MSKTYFFRLKEKFLSVFKWLKRFSLFTTRKLAEYRRKSHKKQAFVSKLKASISGLAAFVSGLLRHDHSLIISKCLGLAAILYFFISLMGSQIIPENYNGDRLLNLVSKILIPPASALVIIDQLQLASIMIIIVTLLLVRKENHYRIAQATTAAKDIFDETDETVKRKYSTKHGVRQLKKFKKYFLYFWFTTLLLYIVFSLDHKNIEFFSLELLSKEGSVEQMVKILFYHFIKFSLATLNLLFIFWCFVVLRLPAIDRRSETRQKQLINYSRFVVILLIAIFPLLLFMIGGPKLDSSQMIEYATIFDGVTGTLSAVVLALLIARMDSKLFGLPWWSVWILFVYASIQPLFIAFAEELPVLKIVETSVLIAALGFKICFFLIVAYSLQSGRVLNYLVCFPFLRDRVDSIFENQFEISLARDKTDKFTILILKKNRLYYSTEERFESRESCDIFVHSLRKRMQNRKAYLPPPTGKDTEACNESGTYWVEVRAEDEEKKLLCESIPLKSKDEADELIHQSIEKIPYCKYNRT